MPMKVADRSFDTMKDACQRLQISRPTMLRYLQEGFLTEPKRHRQGRGKKVRYFDDAWYAINEERLRAARDEDLDGTDA